MPYPKNRTIGGKQNYAKMARIQSNEGVNENEQDNNNDFNLNDLNTSLDDNYSQHQNIQVLEQPPKEYRTIACQTEEEGKVRYSEIHENFDLKNIQDLICVLIDLIPNFGAVHFRLVSTIIYLIFRLVFFPYEKCREILKSIDLMDIKHCHTWAKTIIDEDDICVILRDERRGHKNNNFYEEYPDLEVKAKAYAIEKCSQKNCSFKVHDLAVFVDQIFKENYGAIFEDIGFDSKKLVRPEASCRVDLLK